MGEGNAPRDGVVAPVAEWIGKRLAHDLSACPLTPADRMHYDTCMTTNSTPKVYASHPYDLVLPIGPGSAIRRMSSLKDSRTTVASVRPLTPVEHARYTRSGESMVAVLSNGREIEVPAALVAEAAR